MQWSTGAGLFTSALAVQAEHDSKDIPVPPTIAAAVAEFCVPVMSLVSDVVSFLARCGGARRFNDEIVYERRGNPQRVVGCSLLCSDDGFYVLELRDSPFRPSCPQLFPAAGEWILFLELRFEVYPVDCHQNQIPARPVREEQDQPVRSEGETDQGQNDTDPDV